MSKKKRKKKKKQYTGCPEILIGIFLILAGVYLKKNPEEFENISVNTNMIIIVGALLSTVRIVFSVIFRNSRKRKLLNATIYKIAEMDGVTFEECCIEHFKKLGYKTSPTALSGDYGADIILQKFRTKTVVQCKRYKGNVGVSAIQEVIGAKGYYKADKAMVVTNAYYTPNAITLANANDVELWDRDDLIEIFKIKE